LLAFEQGRQLLGVDTGHRNVCADAVDNQREQQEDQTATQVTVLAC